MFFLNVSINAPPTRNVERENLVKNRMGKIATATAATLSFVFCTAAATPYSRTPEIFVVDGPVYMEVSTDIHTLRACTKDHHLLLLDTRIGVPYTEREKIPSLPPQLTEKFVREMRDTFNFIVAQHPLENFLPPNEEAYGDIVFGMEEFFDTFAAENNQRLMWNPKIEYLKKDAPSKECLDRAAPR